MAMMFRVVLLQTTEMLVEWLGCELAEIYCTRERMP